MRRHIPFALLLVLCAISLTYYGWSWSRHGLFWDLAVYQSAVDDLHAGLDPWRAGAGLPFVYSPLVLRGFSLLDALGSLRLALFGLYAASLVGVWHEAERLLRASLPEPRHRLALLMLAAASFGGIGVISVLGGNLTLWLHLALLAIVCRCVATGARAAPSLLPALILLAALVKPYFLADLALLFALPDRRRAVLQSLAVLIGAGLCWALSYQAWPAEYASFLTALKAQALDGSDNGYSFFGLLRQGFDLADPRLPLLLHALIVLASAALFLLVFDRDDQRLLSARPLLLFALLALTNPRMKDYDFAAAVLAFFLYLQSVWPARCLSLCGLGVGLSLIPIAHSLIAHLHLEAPQPGSLSGVWQMRAFGLIVIGTRIATTVGTRPGLQAAALPPSSA